MSIKTVVDYLCLAGGVALNCVANGRILRENIFKDIWIQPAAGDAGGALGISIKARFLHAICFSLIISNLDNILKRGHFGIPSLIEWIYRKKMAIGTIWILSGINCAKSFKRKGKIPPCKKLALMHMGHWVPHSAFGMSIWINQEPLIRLILCKGLI
jgi:hypothetical protein